MIDWLGLHRDYLLPGEMEFIVDLLRRIEARTMVEIGCRDGRTACVLLHNVASLERYIGIEPFPSYVPGLEQQRHERVNDSGHLALRDRRFELWMRERGSLDLVPDDLPACDAVFIDGDHSEDAVLHDSDLAAAATRRRGGVIIWHDYDNVPDVSRAILRLRGRGWPIEIVPRTWLAYRSMP